MKEAFEKMTGMPDAWTNPALMVSRNAFIQGWEMCLIRQERNFCPRCGKRTADLTVIHTCTPPQETTE
jgi:hypothetical protein